MLLSPRVLRRPSARTAALAYSSTRWRQPHAPLASSKHCRARSAAASDTMPELRHIKSTIPKVATTCPPKKPRTTTHTYMSFAAPVQTSSTAQYVWGPTQTQTQAHARLLLEKAPLSTALHGTARHDTTYRRTHLVVHLHTLPICSTGSGCLPILIFIIGTARRLCHQRHLPHKHTQTRRHV